MTPACRRMALVAAAIACIAAACGGSNPGDETLEDGSHPAHFAFTAEIPGVFEVELEGSGRLLLQLEIS